MKIRISSLIALGALATLGTTASPASKASPFVFAQVSAPTAYSTSPDSQMVDPTSPDGDINAQPSPQPSLDGGLSHANVPPPPVYHDETAGSSANHMAGAPTGKPPLGVTSNVPDIGGAQPGNYKSGPHAPALGAKMDGAAQMRIPDDEK